MTVTIKVPTLPESVTDGTVSVWHKQVGDYVEEGEILVDLETDKIMMEVPATAAGILQKQLHPTGASVPGEAPLAEIDETAKKPASEPASSPKKAPETTAPIVESSSAAPLNAPAAPSVRQTMFAEGVDPAKVQGSGKKGRILKQDVVKGHRGERREKMSRLRARVADRLLTVQQNAAILTTFNEVNMQPVMDLRKKYKADFEKKHGARLGFMSFFLKASVAALQSFPIINASLDGEDVVYHEYVDIGIAVASKRGLVVPILRNVEQMSMAQVEQTIVDYAEKAQAGQLTMEDLTGGTFTVTNGGTFGSMMSTPILNPPQSGILGMHNIVKRAVVENDQVVIRPMMYLALSYDHRLIDGSDAVQFLVKIKHLLEDPARLLLDI